MSLHVALVGCGKMGSAMAQGWIDQSAINELTIIDPYSGSELNTLATNCSCQHFPEPENSNIKDAHIVILAVKPQVMNEICDSIKGLINDNATIVSIAAGRSIQSFEQIFGTDRPIIRVMPNTPAAIGKGMSVLVGNSHVSDQAKEQTLKLFKVSGEAQIIEDEALMDAVTAVSGSGPAYVFLLIEAMTQAGINSGLSQELSEKLARQTVIGSAYLAEDMSDVNASTLRENVTSPGGTTAAALEVLMGDNGILEPLNKAIKAATNRGKELGE